MALSSLLQYQKVAILDGALGTEVERRAVTISNKKLWSTQLLIDAPEVLQDIHLEYYRSGSDICTTATYQASEEGFAEAGVDEQGAEGLVRLAVDLVVAARDQFWQEYNLQLTKDTGKTEGKTVRKRHRPLVGLSCGSYGASDTCGGEFTGDWSEGMSLEDIMAYHKWRLEAVRGDNRIDVLCFETLPCTKEAEAILRLLREGSYGLPAWVSFSCKNDGSSTNHGESIVEHVVPLMCGVPPSLVAAFGVNCTSPDRMEELLAKAYAAVREQPGDGVRQVLLTYPNSGEEWDNEKRCWKTDVGLDLDAYAAAAVKWVAAGAQLVGGCCRTTPEHIRALRRVLLEGGCSPQTEGIYEDK